MITTIKNRFLLEMYQTTNRMIYFLKRLPLLGTRIPERFYRLEEFKILFAIYAVLQKLSVGILGNALYLVGLCLPIFMVLDEPSAVTAVQYACYGLLLFSLLFAPFFYNKVYDESEQSFILIKVFRANPKTYAIYNALGKETMKTIWFLPGLVLSAVVAGAPWYFAPMVFLELLAAKYFGAAVLMRTYARLRNPNNKVVENILAVVFLCVLVAVYVVPLFLEMSVNALPLLIHPLFFLFYLLLGVVGVFSLLKTSAASYHQTLGRLYNVETQMKLKKVVQNSTFSDVQLNEKKFKQAELRTNRFDQLQGFSYLNALFFERHSRLVRWPMLVELLIVALLGVAMFVGGAFVPGIMQDAASRLMQGYAVFAFIIYICSTAPRMTRAMFYNCDISLLHYSYYRTKGAVLSTFQYRLRRVVWYNLAPVLLLVAELTVFLPYHGIALTEVLVLDMILILLSLFFSVHFLFLYYILQPYTEQLNTKNPLFNIVNVMTYMLCFLCWMNAPPSNIFAICVLLLTVVYIPTAIYLVHRFAPRTFRLK